MTLTVVTALPGQHEAELVRAIEAGAARARVTRRCADMVEVYAAVEAGAGRVVIADAALPGLDQVATARLHALGAVVVALTRAGGSHAATPGADYCVANADETLALLSTLEPVAGLPRPSQPEPPPPQRGGRTIAVWGPTGAPGRTTVATTLAAHVGRRDPGGTLLIDADAYGGAIANALGLLDESSGLAQALRLVRGGELDAVALARLAPDVAGFRVLTGLLDPRRWPTLPPACVAGLLQAARDLVALTIVDLGFGIERGPDTLMLGGAGRDDLTLAFLAAADAVIVVGSADPIGLARLIAAVPAVRELVPDIDDRMQVVLNKVAAHQVTAVRRALAHHAGLEPRALLPADPEACARALDAGRTLPESSPNSPLTRACAALADALAQ